MKAKLSSVSEVALWVADVEASIAWYQERFDLVVEEHSPGQHAFLNAGSFLLVLFNPQDPGSQLSRDYLARTGGPQGDVYHVAFATDRATIDAAAGQVQSLGTEVKGPVDFDNGRRSYFFDDPDGHYLELTDR